MHRSQSETLIYTSCVLPATHIVRAGMSEAEYTKPWALGLGFDAWSGVAAYLNCHPSRRSVMLAQDFVCGILCTLVPHRNLDK